MRVKDDSGWMMLQVKSSPRLGLKPEAFTSWCFQIDFQYFQGNDPNLVLTCFKRGGTIPRDIYKL